VNKKVGCWLVVNLFAHSTAPEDLMYPTIETNFPYISDCDIDAMEKLYDGGNTSEVICES